MPSGKEWLTREAGRLGYQASQLAGVHVHFFLSTLLKAKAGDFGVFATAAEWLDVNYGSLVRELLVRSLPAHSIMLIDPAARPFPRAATTAAIMTFTVGTPSTRAKFRKIGDLIELGDLDKGTPVPRERMAAEQPWSGLIAPRHSVPTGYVELGELCRVHRGAVTGKNRVWIAGPHGELLPASVLKPTVTRAKEVIDAGDVLADATVLRRVIDLPDDLDTFDGDEREEIDRFLREAKARGAREGYVAQNCKSWWAVTLGEPAPMISTSMCRRPPAFALNLAQARLLNIAHGLYPRETQPVVAVEPRAVGSKEATGD